MVEYAPVDIGGITYFCPKRSVSISRSRTTRDIRQWVENFKVYAPFETKLSEQWRMTNTTYSIRHHGCYLVSNPHQKTLFLGNSKSAEGPRGGFTPPRTKYPICLQ